MIEVSLFMFGLIIFIIISRSLGSATTPGKSINVKSGFCGPEIETLIGSEMNFLESSTGSTEQVAPIRTVRRVRRFRKNELFALFTVRCSLNANCSHCSLFALSGQYEPFVHVCSQFDGPLSSNAFA